MLATGLAENHVVWAIPWRPGGSPIKVLPVAAVFGANGSGKTNLLKAMHDMRYLVLHSFRSGSPKGGMFRRPFVLDPDAQREPSRFEVDILLSGVRHQYGFVIDDERVIEEWAYRFPKGRAALLFHRRLNDVEHGAAERSTGRTVSKLLRPNALFLSTAASTNHPVLLPLYEWFIGNMALAEAVSRQARQAMTTEMLDDPSRRERVVDLLRVADLGITGAKKHPLDPEMKERLQRVVRILAGTEGEPDGSDDGPDFDQLGVRLVHRGAEGEVEMQADDESLGTLVWFGLVGPVVSTLVGGTTLLADELDASLHPALVEQLIRLFQNPDTNPHHAQLIFNSHDPTLLGDSATDRLIGRDQVWFTEKGEDGSTRLYPLSDLSPRKEEAVGRRYLAGRYGATPILSSREFAATAELITDGHKG
jgi:hypothetical protein